MTRHEQYASMRHHTQVRMFIAGMAATVALAMALSFFLAWVAE